MINKENEEVLYKKLFALLLALLLFIGLCSCTPWRDPNYNENTSYRVDAKPVIYLYPEFETHVVVTLDYAGITRHDNVRKLIQQLDKDAVSRYVKDNFTTADATGKKKVTSTFFFIFYRVY